MSDHSASPSTERRKAVETANAETSQASTKASQDSSNQRKKIFNDPIHGSIELHWLLVKIIDTPQFQRLRRLKQLGTTCFVFPGASHTRFEHCIGTCHLAGLLLQHLNDKQKELEIKPNDILCVEIAALCHDLGHGPFSHMFQDFVAELKPEKNWKHEQASVRMFDYMIEKNNLMQSFEKAELNKDDLVFIKELIDCKLKDQTWPYKGRGVDKSFLYEIVSNDLNGVDVDKFDYFARDSYYLGTKVSFDHMRFIKFYRVIKADNGRRHLCLRDKEVEECYSLFFTRYDLHRRAYQHPVSSGINLMLIDAFILADRSLHYTGSEENNIDLSDTISDMCAFSQLDDDILTLIKFSKDPNLSKAQEILHRIERREIYRYIGHIYVKPMSDLEEKEWKEKMRKEIFDSCGSDCNKINIAVDHLAVELVKSTCGDRDEDPIQSMWFYTKENPDQAIKLDRGQISALKPETFVEYDIRLYCKKSDPTICSILRDKFKEYCGRQDSCKSKEPSK